GTVEVTYFDGADWFAGQTLFVQSPLTVPAVVAGDLAERGERDPRQFTLGLFLLQRVGCCDIGPRRAVGYVEPVRDLVSTVASPAVRRYGVRWLRRWCRRCTRGALRRARGRPLWGS